MESLVALADVFAVSVDALLGVDDAHAGPARGEYRYESATNYDVDGGKHFDIDCGSVYACMIRGYDGEQLRVRVVSNTVANLARHFKVSVDDRPNAWTCRCAVARRQRDTRERRRHGDHLGAAAVCDHGRMRGEGA
ncbi:transcriptional regulator [Bifidobacterium pseudolongum subsp. pseudolongum]|nr:transcriptional regulator [Bifidobacterium pseudolongum subsp. pseudolongum]